LSLREVARRVAEKAGEVARRPPIQVAVPQPAPARPKTFEELLREAVRILSDFDRDAEVLCNKSRDHASWCLYLFELLQGRIPERKPVERLPEDLANLVSKVAESPQTNIPGDVREELRRVARETLRPKVVLKLADVLEHVMNKLQDVQVLRGRPHEVVETVRGLARRVAEEAREGPVAVEVARALERLAGRLEQEMRIAPPLRAIAQVMGEVAQTLAQQAEAVRRPEEREAIASRVARIREVATRIAEVARRAETTVKPAERTGVAARRAEIRER
jgi:hypothetical protein